MKIFDDTLQGLEKSMDLHFKRHAVLASDVANSETPKFHARELDFAGQLKKAFEGNPAGEVAMTNPKHMDLTAYTADHIVFDNTGAMGADGNNVDIDITMGKISENANDYEGAANLIGQKFRFIKQFIRRGGS